LRVDLSPATVPTPNPKHARFPALDTRIEAVIALDAQPALRNLRITQVYHDSSRALATVLGDANLNWCTFAVWASKTAGRFVRGEPVAMLRDAVQSDRRLAQKLDRINALIRRIDGGTPLGQLIIIEALKAPVRNASRYITSGNLAVFAELGRECVTRSFMTLRLPEGEIYLGQDLRTSPGQKPFPPALQSIELAELRSLLAAYKAVGSGAADWADIPERMRFILTLFRARQQDRRRFEEPFGDAPRRDIGAGQMPAGAL
jgi:hypothetical protein